MKVLIYGHHYFTYDLKWGFEQIGCEAEVAEFINLQHFLPIMLAGGFDLIITCGAPLLLDRNVLNILGVNRPIGLRHIHWDTDGISSRRYSSKSGEGIEMDVICESKPDLTVTMCPEMYEMISQKGFACAKMHYAYSPQTHHPMPEYYDEEHKYINLIGHSYFDFYDSDPNHLRFQALRVLLKPLVENGYVVNIYGDPTYISFVREKLGIQVPFSYYRGIMSYEKTCAVYNSSFINIVTQNHNHTLTKRTFEILGAGGFVLSFDNEEIRRLFVPGRDLVVSSSPEQTLELVRHYENNMEEWREIRKNAPVSVQNHTYKQRAALMLEDLDKAIERKGGNLKWTFRNFAQKNLKEGTGGFKTPSP